MELGHGPKELVFQMFYCTISSCYIQSFGKSSKPLQTQNNPQKLQLQGASDSEKWFDWKRKPKAQGWGEKRGIACAGREMSKNEMVKRDLTPSTIPPPLKKSDKGNEKSPVQKGTGQMLEQFPSLPQVFGFISPLISVEDLGDLKWVSPCSSLCE